jgi:hypothetical protein
MLILLCKARHVEGKRSNYLSCGVCGKDDCRWTIVEDVQEPAACTRAIPGADYCRSIPPQSNGMYVRRRLPPKGLQAPFQFCRHRRDEIVRSLMH